MFSGFFVAGKERARVLKFGDEKFAALFLAPSAEVLAIGDSDCRKEFGGRLIMGFGVVADIKRGKVESEDFSETLKREDPLVGGKFGVGFVKGLEGEVEIGNVLTVVLVFFLGEFLAEESDEGLPWFLTIAEGNA